MLSGERAYILDFFYGTDIIPDLICLLVFAMIFHFLQVCLSVCNECTRNKLAE